MRSLVFAAALCLAASLFGDHFPYQPPKNFTVNPAYIALHHPTSTKNEQAQRLFDQGFTFLYAFNHDAAYWSFLKASEADPKMAMAYWGMAYALGTNINMPITPERSQEAVRLVEKAVQLAKNGPENEKEYSLALAKRYSSDPKADQTKLNRAYSDAMRKVSEKYPDDLDAAVLFAESLLDISPWNQWTVEGQPQEGTMEAVKTLEAVIRFSPNHLGANHFFIHAVEASKNPEIALMSAERLSHALPSSGHILHMPSHIYLLVGDYAKAAEQNRQAIAADKEYIRQYGLDGIYPLHYLSHNYYFLSRACIMEGDYQGAKNAAQELVNFYVPHFKEFPEMEYYALAPLTVLITFHRWNEILEFPQPDAAMQMYNVIWRFARGVAYAHLGQREKALEEQKAFVKLKGETKGGEIFGYNQADKIISIADLCLTAQIAEGEGNQTQAVDSLKKAVAEQDKLRYNEPPDWFFPVRETLGGLLLRMQKFEDAEVIFREELIRHPRSGRALFGLKESLKAQSKNYDIYWVDQAFQTAWKNSDVQLTVEAL